MILEPSNVAYVLAACLVSTAPAAAKASGRGGGRTADAPVAVFDCRLPAETGHVVPHERLVWVSPAGQRDTPRWPRYRPHPTLPGVVELTFGSKLDAAVALNCGGASSELIRSVAVRGKTATVTLGSHDVRWRVERAEQALLVWSPRRVVRAISRRWPGPEAATILDQARQLGMAPDTADEMARRLDAGRLRAKGLVALAEGRNEVAAEALMTAFEAVPNDVEAGLALARARYRLRRYDGAEEVLESLAGVAPKSAEIRHEQGLLALSLAERDEARGHFLAAAAGGWRNAHFYLGFLAFEDEDDAMASAALGRFLAAPGDDPLNARARTMLEVIRDRAVTSPPARRAVPRPAAPAPPPAPASARSSAPDVAPGLSLAAAASLVLRGFERPNLPLARVAGKPLVLHLWATWCPPCRVEMPSLMRFVAQELPALAERDVTLVTVSMDYTEDELAGAVGSWAAEHEGSLPAIYWDPEWHLAERLGLGSALPQTVLVRADGTIEAVWVGARDWQEASLIARLARLAEAND